MFKKDSIWVYSMGAAALVITVYLYFGYFTPEWQSYQSDFREMVEQKFGRDRVASIPHGLQQVWVKDLDRVDRCTTCHQGIEWKGLESAKNPFKAHSKEILEKHPIQQFGCTSCHGGQGYATDTESAHGPAPHWEEPLLGKELGDLYLIKDRKAMMQVNCNECHRYERETKGADYINDAKKLVQEKNCRACHSINGRGGVIGPDLTAIGDKSAEQYDYSRISGVKTAFAWHVAHLQNPKALVPETVMPNFSFSSREAQALALLAMSWKREKLPTRYIPGATPADRPTAVEAEKERQMLAGEGAFFVKKGCFICHSVNTLGIESSSKIGPDLSDAVADVQSRFGRTLDDFLNNPTGTMAVVLSTQIQLTDEERREAIEKLRFAYQKRQELKAAEAAQSQAQPKKEIK